MVGAVANPPSRWIPPYIIQLPRWGQGSRGPGWAWGWVWGAYREEGWMTGFNNRWDHEGEKADESEEEKGEVDPQPPTYTEARRRVHAE